MATNRSNVMKELHKLLRRADKLYDGQVEFVLDYGEKIEINEGEEDTNTDDKHLNVFFFITPNDGLYKNARVKFHMRVDVAEYPYTSPEINCRNSIYHPNINFMDHDSGEDDADICVNVLGSDWEPEVGLDGAVMAVLFLFYNPQLDDALSPVCAGNEDYDEYAENVKRSLRGEEIDGNKFDKLLLESADTDDDDDQEVPTKVEKDIAKTTGEKEKGGACAVPENIVDDVEKEEDTALNNPDAEPENALKENSVTTDNAVNPEITENVLSGDPRGDAATSATRVTETVGIMAAVPTDIPSENNVSNCTSADSTMEPKQQIVFKSTNMTHPSALKNSVFKSLYLKLKNTLPRFFPSFGNRS